MAELPFNIPNRDPAIMDTTLIFVRHGQSIANTEKFFAGHIDVPLTDIGLMQAEKMAGFLKKFPISAIYSSDLIRCTETARPIASHFSLPVNADMRLREAHAGVWQKKGFDYLTASKDYNVWRTATTDFRPEGGENMYDLLKRVYAAISEITEKHRGETVAVVTHATPIRVLKTMWEGVPLSALTAIGSPKNASITIVNYKENGDAEVILDSENSFLGDLSAAPTTQM